MRITELMTSSQWIAMWLFRAGHGNKHASPSERRSLAFENLGKVQQRSIFQFSAPRILERELVCQRPVMGSP